MRVRSAQRLLARCVISTLVGAGTTFFLSSSAVAGSTCAGVTIGADPADSTVLTSQGHVCVYTYDAEVSTHGQASAAVQLAEPGAATFAYDTQGQLVSDTGPDATTTTYDARGRIVSDTQNSNVTSYSYDTDSQLTKTIDPTVGTTTYAYDSMGRLLSTTNGSDTTSYGYDSAGDLSSTIDSSGRTVQYTYDADNRVIEVTELMGSIVDRTTSYTYDAAGNVIDTTDSIDGKTQYLYDASGQIISDTDPLGHVTKYSYDAAGNLLSETDTGGNTDFVYTSSVPEPATWATLLTGLGILGFMMGGARRKRLKGHLV